MTTDHKPFLDYITGLAAEGETALLTRQTPVKTEDGKLQYHGDGVLKATFPAFMPEKARIKKGDSWYINTASFVVDRMTDKVSAKRQNAEYVLFMMLDDVATEKVPNVCPLPPTWIMETSEGSKQWGYAFTFDEQPTKGEFSAAIRAIAAAGYTDPGAINAVRNCRIPGSVNTKQGRGGFEARLVEFNPDREYTLQQLCDAMGVVPGEPDATDYPAITLADTGADSVLRWLSDTGLILMPANGEGWIGIACPNGAKHSDGNPEARYKPIDRTFVCYHGCWQGFGSTEFLARVADNDGPAVQHGLRDDVLAERMREALQKIEPSEMFGNVADERVAEVERREMSRVERNQWFQRFAYIQSDDAYFDLDTRRMVSRKTFNAMYRGIGCYSKHGTKPSKVEASVYYDEHRDEFGAIALVGLTYAPGDDVIVVMDGLTYGNLWSDARPDVSESAKVSDAQVKRWLDHCRNLVPDPEQLKHCLDVMAFKTQHPKVKINHAVLHGGDEGSGKDTMWAPMIWAVCGPSYRNRAIVGEGMFNDTHTEAYQTEILILNELREPEVAARRALADKLKPVIAAPPETLPVNIKYLRPYQVVNRLFVLSFTNHPVPISLPSQDRRWCCIWSHNAIMSEKDAAAMWKWYTSGGFALIAAWLHQRDISAFNPKAKPVSTDWHQSMIENGRSNAESYLVDLIKEKRGPFSPGVVAAPWNLLLDQLHAADLVPQNVKLPPQALLHSMKEAGWKDCGRLASSDYPNKKQIFATQEMVDSKSKSELRRIVEQPVASKIATLKAAA